MSEFWREFIDIDPSHKDRGVKREYLFYWAKSMPEGWYKAFAAEMIEELLDILEEHGNLEEYTVLQVKEKYGRLAWYAGSFLGEIPQSYWDWIDKYEELSEKYCTQCGKLLEEKIEFPIPICVDCYKKHFC